MAVNEKISTTMVWARDVSTRTYMALTGRILSHPFLKKNRTVILISVCIWLFVIAASAVLTRNAKSNLLNEFYDTGVRSANQMSEEINAPLLANDILTLNIAIKVLEKKLDPIFAAILDHSGTALAHSDPDIINKKLPALDALKKLTTIKGVSVKRGQYRAHKAVICFSRGILFSNVSIGKIIFAMDADKLNQADKRYNTILGVIITLSTLLLAGVIFMANSFRLQKEAKELAAFENMEKIGPYILQKKIAQGGMAELYIAQHILEDGFKRTVAIKKILPHLAQNEEFVAMFIREARLAAMLQHPNIVQIYDLIKIYNGSLIAMEYVEGKNLAEVMAKEQKGLPVDMTIFIIQKISSGLYYSHSKKAEKTGEPLNIVHRDISPQNMLISYKGEVKISDFGISKARSEPSFTQAGVIKGKLSYLSPEQALGKEVDHQADIYALGIIFYEILTGKRLYRFENELEAILKIPTMVIPPIMEQRPDIPKKLNTIVEKCLKKEKVSRYQTGKELHDDLIKLKNSMHMTYDESNLTDFMIQRFPKPAR